MKAEAGDAAVAMMHTNLDSQAYLQQMSNMTTIIAQQQQMLNVMAAQQQQLGLMPPMQQLNWHAGSSGHSIHKKFTKPHVPVPANDEFTSIVQNEPLPKSKKFTKPESESTDIKSNTTNTPTTTLLADSGVNSSAASRGRYGKQYSVSRGRGRGRFGAQFNLAAAATATLAPVSIQNPFFANGNSHYAMPTADYRGSGGRFPGRGGRFQGRFSGRAPVSAAGRGIANKKWVRDTTDVTAATTTGEPNNVASSAVSLAAGESSS